MEMLRAKMQRTADQMDVWIANASAPDHAAAKRRTYVRLARQGLRLLEDAAAAMAPGQVLKGADEARQRLNLIGDDLGMSRDDEQFGAREAIVASRKGGRGRLRR